MSKSKTTSFRNRKSGRGKQPKPQPDLAKPTTTTKPTPLLRWGFLALCLVLTSALTYYGFANYVWSQVPAELVGRWEVKGGPQDGAILEFHRNGTLTANVNVEGYHGASSSHVKATRTELIITSKHPRTGERKTQTQKIEKLTNKELVLVAENGTTYRLVRLR